jgi:hypothetical protein
MAGDLMTNRVNYAGVMSTAAAIGAAALLLKQQKAGASEPPFTLPPELMELLIAQTADIAAIAQWLATYVPGTPGSNQGYPPNCDYPYTGKYDFPVAFVAQRLPWVEIPDDFALVIKAYPTNPAGSLVLVGRTASDALSINSGWPLVPNESIAYRIKQAEDLWVASTVGAVPNAVIWTVELRR